MRTVYALAFADVGITVITWPTDLAQEAIAQVG